MKIFFSLRKLSTIPLLGRFFIFIYKIFCLINNAAIPLEVEIDKSNIFPHGIRGIFISKEAVIGKYNIIYHQVTIGKNQIEKSKKYGSPSIGDYCLIGAGAKIIGKINIADNVSVGANATVVHDIDANSIIFNQCGIIKK